MEKIKTADKASISITRVKSVLVGLKETESNKVCTRLIRKNSYESVQFLRSVQNTEKTIVVVNLFFDDDNFCQVSIPNQSTDTII